MPSVYRTVSCAAFLLCAAALVPASRPAEGATGSFKGTFKGTFSVDAQPSQAFELKITSMRRASPASFYVYGTMKVKGKSYPTATYAGYSISTWTPSTNVLTFESHKGAVTHPSLIVALVAAMSTDRKTLTGTLGFGYKNPATPDVEGAVSATRH